MGAVTEPAAAFVGLGRMGLAIAIAAVRSGHPVTGFDPVSEAGAALVAAGGAVATSIGDAVSGADVVVVTVNDDTQVRHVMLGSDGVLARGGRGTVVVLHSTIGHAALREVLVAAEGTGIDVLDAGISGALGTHSIPDLAVMVGGSAYALARAEPLLRCYASLVVRVGESGRGLDAKLALNLLRYVSFTSQLEARRFASALGIGDSFGALVAHVRPTDYLGGPSSHTPDLAATEDVNRRWMNVAIAEKDLAAAAARAAEVGAQLPMADAGRYSLPGVWGLPFDSG